MENPWRTSMRKKVSGVCPPCAPPFLFPFGNGPFLPRELRGFWWFLYRVARRGRWDGESNHCASVVGSQSRIKAGLPHDLDREIEDARRKGEKVEQLSTGLDGDWFLRTDKRLGTFPPTPGPACPSHVFHLLN
jgi:hypothetical protein